MVATSSRRTAGRPPGAPHRGAWWASRRFERRYLPWLLLAPAVVVILGLVMYPVVRTAWLSLTDADLLNTAGAEFVGLENYQDILTDPDMRAVFVRTVVFGIACVIGTMVLGIAVALFLNVGFRGHRLLAILVLLPWAMPHVAAGTVWQWLFDAHYGIVNWVLTGVGLDFFHNYVWFIEPLPAFIAVAVVVIWQSFPLIAVSVLAGLQAVPKELDDAARVDGASSWQRLWRVRLPLLRPLLTVLLVISTIWDFKVFDQIKVMTDGGPNHATETASIAIYREAIALRDVDTGSAMAMVLFLILIIVSILYIRLIGKEATTG